MKFKVLTVSLQDKEIENKFNKNDPLYLDRFSCEDESGKKYDNCSYFHSKSEKRLEVGQALYGNMTEGEYNGKSSYKFSKESKKKQFFGNSFDKKSIDNLSKSILFNTFFSFFSKKDGVDVTKIAEKAIVAATKVFNSISEKE
jgi:hypothetical protein